MGMLALTCGLGLGSLRTDGKDIANGCRVCTPTSTRSQSAVRSVAMRRIPLFIHARSFHRSVPLARSHATSGREEVNLAPWTAFPSVFAVFSLPVQSSLAVTPLHPIRSLSWKRVGCIDTFGKHESMPMHGGIDTFGGCASMPMAWWDRCHQLHDERSNDGGRMARR